ncbi:MAG: DHA1 family multidrug resistance protein-like MFS transporter [Halobacteriales archaeon]|jgi:DHA1 family multidrug resistance protein-like MFS transporter
MNVQGFRRRFEAWIDDHGVSRELFSLSLAQSIAAFGGGLVIPMLAPLLAGLPAPMFPESVLGLPVTTELQVGILFSMFGITRSILQIPMGRLSDRVGLRRLFVEIGMLLSAVTLYLYSIAGTVGVLVSVRMAQGAAIAISTPALMALVESITEHRSRGGSMGFFSSMRTLGWGLGPIVGGVIADTYGLTAAFATGALLTVFAVGMIHLTVPEVRAGEGEGKPEETEETIADGGHAGHGTLILGTFTSRQQATTFLGLGIAMATLMMGFAAVVAMENPILERIGGSKAGFGLVFAITTLTRFGFQFPIGIASDSYGRKPFIVGGLLVSAPLVALMGFAHSFVEFFALRALLGVALAGVIAPAYAVAADVADDALSGQQMAVLMTAFSVGFAFGPIVAGAVAFKGFAVPFVLAGVLTVVGTVGAWWFVDEPQPA